MVVVQNNLGNIYSDTVIVVPVTSRAKPIQPTHFSITLEEESTVLCEQIQTIERDSLKKKIYYLSGEEMAKLDQALRSSIDLR